MSVLRPPSSPTRTRSSPCPHRRNRYGSTAAPIPSANLRVTAKPGIAWVSVEKVCSCGTVAHMARRPRKRPEDIAAQLQTALADGDQEAALALTRELEQQLRPTTNPAGKPTTGAAPA